MDDSTITTDPDALWSLDGTSVVTGSAGAATAGVVRRHVSSPHKLTVLPAVVRVYVDANGAVRYESDETPYEMPETPPEAAPSKPPPALPVEAWHSKAFDAEQAHAATLALCRGQ